MWLSYSGIGIFLLVFTSQIIKLLKRKLFKLRMTFNFRNLKHLVHQEIVIIYCACFFIGISIYPSLAFSQVEPPDSESLFIKDNSKEIKRAQERKEQILKTDKPESDKLELLAPNLEYVQGTDKVKIVDGLVVSKGDLKIRANEGNVDLGDQKAILNGDVFFSWPAGSLSSESAEIDIANETGVFKSAELLTEISDFKAKASEINKYSEFDYKFLDTNISPCLCPNGDRPWSIACSKLDVREEGYGKAKDFKFKVNDTTLLYLPYLAFPFKRERQSGVLAPEFGYGERNGFKFSMPYFWDVNESTDIIIKPFTETKTRTGLSLDYNQVYSKKSQIDSRFYFSDESAREGRDRGTNIDDLFDPTFDDQRFAGYIEQSWNSGDDFSVPMSVVSDIHYVSDDLFLREFDDEDLGKYNSRYATSRVVMRATPSQLFSAELSGEYNQSILTDDDLVFQRLPELNIYSQESFRPFGMNSYGLKLVASNKIQAVNFDRKTGYDGNRYNISPTLKIPYHYKNYFNGELSVTGHHTIYDLDEDLVPGEDGSVIEDDQRSLYTLNFSIGTELEKISSVSDDSVLSWITSLGRENQNQKLKRIKHTIEPTIGYGHVPFEDQDDLPLFDSVDRIRERRIVSYGFKSSVFGRFIPDNIANDKILELSPDIEDLPSVNPLTEIADYSLPEGEERLLPGSKVRKGEVRELMDFRVYQTFDYLEEKRDTNPNRSALSDMALDVGFYPSNYFAFKFDSNIDVEDNDFSSWGVSTHLKDDRGDVLRARYSYIEDSISQIEGSLEVALTNSLKLGYYARFDDRDSEFIDNKLALRISSECNCWDLDLGYRKRLNPDEEDIIASFVLKGLGDLNQDFSLLESQNNKQE